MCHPYFTPSFLLRSLSSTVTPFYCVPLKEIGESVYALETVQSPSPPPPRRREFFPREPRGKFFFHRTRTSRKFAQALLREELARRDAQKSPPAASFRALALLSLLKVGRKPRAGYKTQTRATHRGRDARERS